MDNPLNFIVFEEDPADEDALIEVEAGSCGFDDIVEIVESYPSYDGYLVVFDNEEKETDEIPF